MKRELHITINLDTETTGISSTLVYANTLNPNFSRAEITILPTDVIPHNEAEPMLTLLPTMCHELGHAIAGFVETSIVKRERAIPFILRMLGERIGVPSPTIVPIEEEAWDIGQRIFDAVRKIGVDTYKTTEARKLSLSDKLLKANKRANAKVNKDMDNSPIIKFLEDSPPPE